MDYTQSGVDYDVLDAFKRQAQFAAVRTYPSDDHFEILPQFIGSSVFVTAIGNYCTAIVEEQLGTKALISFDMLEDLGPQVFEWIATDTVSTILNDLCTCGLSPEVLTMNIAGSGDEFFGNNSAVYAFLKGWADACSSADVVMGPGETSMLPGIIHNGLFIGGCAVAHTDDKNKLISNQVQDGDIIACLSSNGVQTNGLSLIRSLKKEHPNLYSLELEGESFGKRVLHPSFIYSKFIAQINNLFPGAVHYVSHISGHGLRKIMRPPGNFNYILDCPAWDVPAEFDVIAEYAKLNDYNMYGTYNMGLGMVVIISPDYYARIKSYFDNSDFAFDMWRGGYVEAANSKNVRYLAKNLEYTQDTLLLT